MGAQAMTTQQARVAPVTVAKNLSVSDLTTALAAGWRDFRSAPLYGMFFGLIYVLSGWYLWYALTTRGQSMWLIPVAAGFPLVAPFTAVGLYEVSRRREAGLPLSWGGVLGALRGHGDEQLAMMGGFVFVGFTFWMILAHGIFAIFMSESGMGAESLGLLSTSSGIAMLAVGSVVGAGVAYVFYMVTVISLPMLVDRDVDFLTAIIVSLATVRSNTWVMTIWAAIIALALGAALLPAFAGLLVVLPVLGHATWHLYRRVVPG